MCGLFPGPKNVAPVKRWPKCSFDCFLTISFNLETSEIQNWVFNSFSGDLSQGLEKPATSTLKIRLAKKVPLFRALSLFMLS